MKKGLKGLLLIGIVCIGMVGCSSNSTESNNTKQDENLVSVNFIDINNVDDIKKAYDNNIDKITNNEKIESVGNITFDELVKRSEKAKEIALTIDNTNTKISSIEQLASLDNLYNDISLDSINETLNYLIDEYKNSNLFNSDNLEKNLYLTRFLDRSFSNSKNSGDEASMVFDMYQCIKDSIRISDDGFSDDTKSDLKFSLEANKNQIDKVIDSVKSNL